MLVEPEPDEALEADTYGTGREGETFAFFIAERFEGRRKRGVGGKGVVDLRTWRLGVPLLPDGGRELIRDGGAGDGGLEAVLHDHRAGTEVRHHLSDRPLTGIGRLLDGSVVEGLDDAAKPSNRGGECVEMAERSVGQGAP